MTNHFCYICGRRAHKSLFGHFLCRNCETDVISKRNAIIKLISNESALGMNFIIEFERVYRLASKSTKALSKADKVTFK